MCCSTIFEPWVVSTVTPDHLLLDSAPNLGPLISRWEINKFENCWYNSVRSLEVLKLLFQQFLNLVSSQWDISGPILGALSTNRWSRGFVKASNLELHGNFGPLFQNGLLSSKRIPQKNEAIKSCRKTPDLQIWFCSFSVHGSSKEATELGKKKSKVSLSSKVRGFYGKSWVVCSLVYRFEKFL
jgi:hypothetical protein